MFERKGFWIKREKNFKMKKNVYERHHPLMKRYYLEEMAHLLKNCMLGLCAMDASGKRSAHSDLIFVLLKGLFFFFLVGR